MNVNWYKVSESQGNCKMTLDDIKQLGEQLGKKNYHLFDTREYQESLLEWSRCALSVLDPSKRGKYIVPELWPMEWLMISIAKGEKVVEIPETIQNISRWYGAACLAYLSQLLKDFNRGQFKPENLRSGRWDERLPFWLADKESLERVLEFTKTSEYDSRIVNGSWVYGVMNNPNSPHELQKKIFDDMKKIRMMTDDYHSAEVAIGLMCNPNGNQDVIKSMLEGSIVHGNSALLKMIHAHHGIFNEMWHWKSAHTDKLTPNESVLQVVSEYINKIVSQWHSSMFDSFKRYYNDVKLDSTTLYPMMELVMWMNVYSKNPETIRRNYDTYQKAMLIKARPNEEQSPVSRTASGGLIFPVSYLANNLIMSFVMRQSELKDEDVQQLMEILIRHHLQEHPLGRRQQSSTAEIPIAPLVLSLTSFDTRAGIEGSHQAEISGNFTNKKLKESFNKALRRFDFKTFMKKIKDNPNEFIDVHDNKIGSFHLYSIRLTIVRNLEMHKGASL